jgi:hypothetical protein
MELTFQNLSCLHAKRLSIPSAISNPLLPPGRRRRRRRRPLGAGGEMMVLMGKVEGEGLGVVVLVGGNVDVRWGPAHGLGYLVLHVLFLRLSSSLLLLGLQESGGCSVSRLRAACSLHHHIHVFTQILYT